MKGAAAKPLTREIRESGARFVEGAAKGTIYKTNS